MAEGRKMNSDLMGSSSLQAEFRQAKVLVALHNSPMGSGFPAFSGPDRHFLAVRRMTANDGLNLTFIRNLTQDNANVFPKRRMLLELGG